MLLRAILRWAGISAPSAESVRGKPDRPQPLTDAEVERRLPDRAWRYPGGLQRSPTC